MQATFQGSVLRNPDGGGTVAPETSRQIVAARVICIFFMLSVHVSPGFNAAAYGMGDAMHWIGALWVDVLGRSSVPALSIVSGFLMSAQFGLRGLGQIALDRFGTLVLPMLFWTAVLATLVLAGYEILGARTDAYHRFFAGGLQPLITQHMLFLHGQPANLPLAFLRDLFVCGLIAVALQRLMGRWVVLALPLSILIWQTVGYGEVILRPMILPFVLTGVVLQRGCGHLTPARRLRIAVRVAMVGVVAHHWTGWLAPLEAMVPPDAWLIAFRCIVSAFALDMALVLSASRLFLLLQRWEPVLYLAYLSHSVVICSLWQLLDPLVGGPQGWAYPLFFLAAPVISLLTARVLARSLDHAPAWICMVVSGKASLRRRAPQAA
jgi:uncharacterized membrane protein